MNQPCFIDLTTPIHTPLGTKQKEVTIAKAKKVQKSQLGKNEKKKEALSKRGNEKGGTT